MGGARYINACEGDEMEFFLPDYSPLNFKAKVVSVAANTLKFDSALPNFDNFVLQKSHRTQNILLKNCLFKTTSAGESCKQAMSPLKIARLKTA